MGQPLTDREIVAIQSAAPPAAGEVVPISRLDRFSGTDLTYQTVVSWTVAASRVGNLREVSMISDQLAVTEFRLTINAVVQWTDQIIQAALTIPFGENGLAAGAIVLLEAQSSDGTAIVVDGSISGTERSV